MGCLAIKNIAGLETFCILYNLDKVERHGTDHKGFDWRWLAHTLRQNCKIKKITTSPLQIIPRFLSPQLGLYVKMIKINFL